MMRQMGGMMGLPGRGRKATKSPKNKRKDAKKKGASGARARGGMPTLPPGLPQLPPGVDPARGLPPDFKLPKFDFNKFKKEK
jgi:signal recognition particle subunit SRP54